MRCPACLTYCLLVSSLSPRLINALSVLCVNGFQWTRNSIIQWNKKDFHSWRFHLRHTTWKSDVLMFTCLSLLTECVYVYFASSCPLRQFLCPQTYWPALYEVALLALSPQCCSLLLLLIRQLWSAEIGWSSNMVFVTKFYKNPLVKSQIRN